MTQATARVTLRQLCHLGLPGPVVLPSLLPVLRQVVKAEHAGFFFCDERGSITNLYAERMLPPAVQARYHDRYNDSQFRLHYLARVAAVRPVSRRSVTPEERANDYYRDVLQPLGVEHFLYAIVRSGSRVIGQLSLYRGDKGPAFTARDEELLQEVLHYLGEALGVPSPASSTGVLEQTVEEGMAVFDACGQVVYSDESWGRLIRLAEGNPITPATAQHETRSLPRFVAAVLDAIDASPQALHRTDTAWGSFAFRRHQLLGEQGQMARGLIVSRLSAEPLRLTEGAAKLGLSPRQSDVAVLVARGLTNLQIARELCVSVNTAATHVKDVFHRLDVMDRRDVGPVLIKASKR
ncbi:MAG: GAF domain-containing protein [Hydrogenophaga sp.]|nr:GAF domain-containing protein [Hydrogenophaga sp.]